ncbi:Response regulator receiver domain-containing protein [Terribacillus halophilus]|uniref:Response regulator receiver domain-containing protein n=1 Tax=Terribacillus halophilus TaxID=361279 RepID=A0A1G6VN94_9BACI|nr:Response regulator receiver domain-containing protein [Terribacillus halophilus]
MEKIKAVLVDDNRELVQLMEEYFEDQSDIEVIGTAYNGKDCLDMLEDLQPSSTSSCRMSMVWPFFAHYGKERPPRCRM